MTNIDFYRPKDIQDTLKFLDANTPDAFLINGGSDIMIDIRSGEFKGNCLVDISQISDLKIIKEENNLIYVGAGVTIEELRRSLVINEKLPLLNQAASNFAGLQVRNQGTIGGNVAHASPCGDTQPPLIVYDALAIVSDVNGSKQIPVQNLFTGPYKSVVTPNQLIEGFLLTPHKVKFGKFEKIGRRKDLAISRVTLAVLLNYNNNNIIDFCRLSLGACLPSTNRMLKTEEFLIGKEIGIDTFKEAAKLISQEMISITGKRPSVIYKEPAIEGLTLRILSSLLVNS